MVVSEGHVPVCPPPQGSHCESPCESGAYGKACSLECSCVNAVDCSHLDGTCFCKEGEANQNITNETTGQSDRGQSDYRYSQYVIRQITG